MEQASGAGAKAEAVTRNCSEGLDEILGKAFPVLDDGFVRVVDYMGNDASIVQAARVSYGEGTKKVSEDRGLIRYLMRHQHATPFEMCEIKFHIRIPMDAWRQWVRHRTASINEYSTRYSIAIDAAYSLPADKWRKQTMTNRQGSDGFFDKEAGARLSADEAELHRRCREVYESRIAMGVAREIARKDLPLSTYTEAYWKTNLRNLLHFLKLRMENHAQEEIRDYASVIGNEIVSRWVPLTWEAFKDYDFNAVTLSDPAMRILALLLRGDAAAAEAKARDCGFIRKNKDGEWVRGREAIELESTLARLGVASPWPDLN